MINYRYFIYFDVLYSNLHCIKQESLNNNNNNEINIFSIKTGVETLLLYQGEVPNDIIWVKSVGRPPHRTKEVCIQLKLL